MYVSAAQILTSLDRLRDLHPFFGYAFFGFKKRHLPIGDVAEFNYAYIKKEILDKYFRFSEQEGYFNPFKSTSRWVAERYESTSLQRVIADTFADAFIHEKGSSRWGWRANYIDTLREIMEKTNTSTIPTLDLAIWYYRKSSIPENFAQEFLVEKLFSDFDITDIERNLLFDKNIEGRNIELLPEPVSDIEVLNHVGWPEGSSERAGIILGELRLKNVGPAEQIIYRPSSRINLVTGDNSLGKTFLLDCAWWAITGEWMQFAADPHIKRVSHSEIGYTLSSGSGREEQFLAPYSPLENEWQRPHQPLNGLALYTNYSGSFAVWDTIRIDTAIRQSAVSEPYLIYQREHIWSGLTSYDKRGRPSHISNGLINDWVTWQRSPKQYEQVLAAFETSLRELSPPDGNQLRSGKPVRLAGDSREIPTIRMPYGDIPILYASAGVQRILALAYMLVATWFRHVELAKESKREPLTNIIMMIDEIESHLHPRWQRQIVPALVKAISKLGTELSVQLHISTHSPLVLASVEPLFDTHTDAIHNLILDETDVRLEVLENWKHGSVNYWLESEVFGLKEARSKPAEQILERATKLQLEKKPSAEEVGSVHRELVQLLPDDDPFWVRWKYFYEKHGPKRK